MEEFIENFNEFMDWLYSQKKKAEKDEYDCDTDAVLKIVIDKFEELGLDNAF